MKGISIMQLKRNTAIAAACVAGTFAVAAYAQAQPAAAPAPAPAPAPAAPPSTAINLPYGITISGHAEVGFTLNADDPANNINFGQLFTDQADSIRVNQTMLNIERDLDPKNADWQWGFKFTGMFGSDSRITHFYGELDRVTHGTYQWDVVEADGQMHVPWIGGGTDVKLGQYPTPLGAEVIDATGNTFYTHSYIFNYGLPFKHTGVLSTTHVTDMIDIWAGLDTGSNNSIGQKGMVNNWFPKFLGGFGINGLLGGNLTILGLAHLGPEQPRFIEFNGGGQAAIPNANKDFRQFYDIVTTYKINDNWTSTLELNYARDDLAHATAEGAAGYVSWAVTDLWTVSLRGEVYRDDQGFFVFDPTSGLDAVNAARGLAPNTIYGVGKHTYGELTLGASFKPSGDMGYMTVRPEIRYDNAWGGPFKAFGAGNKFACAQAAASCLGTQNDQFTFSMDVIFGF